MPAPSRTVMQTSSRVASVSAGLFSNSTPEFTIAVPVEEAPEVALFYRWDSGTCFPTRGRHGLSMSGGCQTAYSTGASTSSGADYCWWLRDR